MLKAIREHGLVAALFGTYYLFFILLGLMRGLKQLPFYALFMAAAAALVVLVHFRYRLSAGVLWGLTIWGLAHMAGGLLEVDGRVWYRVQLIPVLLRYDQAVHAFGFGFATLACA